MRPRKRRSEILRYFGKLILGRKNLVLTKVCKTMNTFLSQKQGFWNIYAKTQSGKLNIKIITAMTPRKNKIPSTELIPVNRVLILTQITLLLLLTGICMI